MAYRNAKGTAHATCRYCGEFLIVYEPQLFQPTPKTISVGQSIKQWENFIAIPLLFNHQRSNLKTKFISFQKFYNTYRGRTKRSGLIVVVSVVGLDGRWRGGSGSRLWLRHSSCSGSWSSWSVVRSPSWKSTSWTKLVWVLPIPSWNMDLQKYLSLIIIISIIRGEF